MVVDSIHYYNYCVSLKCVQRNHRHSLRQGATGWPYDQWRADNVKSKNLWFTAIAREVTLDQAKQLTSYLTLCKLHQLSHDESLEYLTQQGLLT